MNVASYKYIPFPFEHFDFSICEKIPYKNQFESHPHIDQSRLDYIKSLFTESELAEIIDNSYYILHDTYDHSSVQSQSNERIMIEDFPFTDIHSRAKPIVENYLESAQGCFTFLIGNNKYRPVTKKLFRHAHAQTNIDDVEYKKTFTVIYPLDSKFMPCGDLRRTEKFHIFHSEETPWVEHKDLYHTLKLPLDVPVPPPSKITTIPFPSANNMLLIEFNSVNGIHWIDGLLAHNYMCHVFDAVVMKESLDA